MAKRESLRERLVLTAGLLAACVLTTTAHGQDVEKAASIFAPKVVADELVGPGYQRVHWIDRAPISVQELNEIIASGKTITLDPVTGEAMRPTWTDYLPEGWMLSQPDGVAGRIDSFGNPIVNEVLGLPGWAQRDVDALLTSMTVALQRVVPGNREREMSAGNFIGQALVRGIDISATVNILDRQVVTRGVADSVVRFLTYYENLRFAHAQRRDVVYSPTSYNATTIAFLKSLGLTSEQVQRIESSDFNPRGSCYIRSAFVGGVTELAAPTIIWQQSGTDDASADVAIGWGGAQFYGCLDANNRNGAVRVSTNGYLTFFQQGGGALDGTDFSNDPLPDVADPDGFAAPNWDDLYVEPAQGEADRVGYATEGAIGSRVFTVQWLSMSHFSGDGSEFFWFQVKMYEADDEIEFHYGGWDTGPNDSATRGLETVPGDEAQCSPNCVATNVGQPADNQQHVASGFAPANDACANAIAVTPGLYFGDVTHASNDDSASCGSSGTNRDVWYSYTATCDGLLTVNTCGTHDAYAVDQGMDTVLALFRGCGGTELDCNDDADPICPGSLGLDYDSRVQAVMEGGQTVLIRVSHFSASIRDGLFRLSVGFQNDIATNTDCASAQNLPGIAGFVVGDLTCAGDDGDNTNCGGSSANADVYYRFTAPANGTVLFTTCGTHDAPGVDLGMDTAISAHSGCPATAGNTIACNDDDNLGCNIQQGAFFDSALSFNMVSGQTVRVRVSHFGGSISNGEFRLTYRFERPCPADYDGDGFVTGLDFDLFVADFEAGDPNSDFDGDGFITGLDFDAFVAAFEAGC